MDMPNKEVIISITGTQSLSGGENNLIELVTEGTYYKNEDRYYAIYAETEITGMEGTTTTVVIEPERVMLTRVGSVNSQLTFEKGHKHVSYYDTSGGAFTVGIFTKEIYIKIGDAGGEIKIDYQLEIDNEGIGKNDFHLTIREVNADEESY